MPCGSSGMAGVAHRARSGREATPAGCALIVALLLVSMVGEVEAQFEACSLDPSDPFLTEFDAVPGTDCSDKGCSAGEFFNIDWDGDGSGCMDDGMACCFPCDPNTFQPVDSTADPTTRAELCTTCAEATDPTTGAWISPPQFVSSGCGDANAGTDTTQTGLTECSTPSTTQFVSARCDPGSASSPGTDTQIADCSQPSATQFTSIPCFSGSTAECTDNFPSTTSLDYAPLTHRIFVAIFF